MRIAFTSDIHGDVTEHNRRILPHLSEAVSRSAPDAFIIAGDAANDLAALNVVLAAFAGLSVPRLFVPGNHDLWLESKKALRRREDSWHKYINSIPQVCRTNGFHCLVGSPREIGGVAFVGSVGWYDYSLADPRLSAAHSADDYERGEFQTDKGLTSWNDVSRAAFLRTPGASDWSHRRRTMTNREVFNRVSALLEADLSGVRADTTLVAVLHTAPFAECLKRKDSPDPFDAYEGSARLGQLLAAQAARRRTVCITGHRHKPLDVVVEGVRVLRQPVGYLDDAPTDLPAHAAQCIGMLDLPSSS